MASSDRTPAGAGGLALHIPVARPPAVRAFSLFAPAASISTPPSARRDSREILAAAAQRSSHRPRQRAIARGADLVKPQAAGLVSCGGAILICNTVARDLAATRRRRRVSTSACPRMQLDQNRAWILPVRPDGPIAFAIAATDRPAWPTSCPPASERTPARERESVATLRLGSGFSRPGSRSFMGRLPRAEAPAKPRALCAEIRVACIVHARPWRQSHGTGNPDVPGAAHLFVHERACRLAAGPGRGRAGAQARSPSWWCAFHSLGIAS